MMDLKPADRCHLCRLLLQDKMLLLQNNGLLLQEHRLLLHDNLLILGDVDGLLLLNNVSGDRSQHMHDSPFLQVPVDVVLGGGDVGDPCDESGVEHLVDEHADVELVEKTVAVDVVLVEDAVGLLHGEGPAVADSGREVVDEIVELPGVDIAGVVGIVDGEHFVDIVLDGRVAHGCFNYYEVAQSRNSFIMLRLVLCF